MITGLPDFFKSVVENLLRSNLLMATCMPAGSKLFLKTLTSLKPLKDVKLFSDGSLGIISTGRLPSIVLTILTNRSIPSWGKDPEMIRSGSSGRRLSRQMAAFSKMNGRCPRSDTMALRYSLRSCLFSRIMILDWHIFVNYPNSDKPEKLPQRHKAIQFVKIFLCVLVSWRRKYFAAKCLRYASGGHKKNF